MDVRLSNILNSAEKLVRDKDTKPQAGSTPSGKGEWVAREIQDKAEFSNLITGKFQTIQSRLKDLQGQLSKEQMRLSYLKEEDVKSPADLIHVLFGKEPLFPEIESNPRIDLDTLRASSEKKLSDLETEIRQKEVENENVVSLGVQDNLKDFGKMLEDIDSLSWKPMSEKTVQKLIES